jgi:hypothetical protein
MIINYYEYDKGIYVDLPTTEIDVLVSDCFYIKSDCGNSVDSITQIQLV